MELQKCITAFFTNVASLKGQIINGFGDADKKMDVIYKTLKYYSECKKEILGEDFEVPDRKILEQHEENSDNGNDSSDGSESDCESEYEFSDIDESMEEKKCSTMANSVIILNNIRQSKMFVRISKKNCNVE
ncbi:MAG: hypothetical protein EBQ92_03150 [Proteobacteria bacterium]|nr:hypothetical protein [Pseudomonadota bacterium]